MNHLTQFLPENALFFIEKWSKPYKLIIQVKHSRKRKLGDYRYPKMFQKHHITINNNLDEELFFLTLTHEIAHMLCYAHFSPRKISPHGKEWKNIFGNLILESLEIYTEDFQKILHKFAQNPKAGYYSDLKIIDYFNQKLNKSEDYLFHLNEGESFLIENKTYLLVKKNRTRYICKNISSGKRYLINSRVAIIKTN